MLSANSASPAATPSSPFGAVTVEKAGKQQVLYAPFPHQARFHASTAANCLMEGGGGSGKSKCIRWDAYIRCLTIPRYRALILRRSMPELRMSHLAEVPFEAELLGLSKDAWHSTFNILRFPNGSTLEFGHIEDDQALPRYLSSEFEAIYFDELATFTLRQFKFLASRARTTKPGVKPLVRGGTNPVGSGAGWVRRYFITKNVSPEEDQAYRAEDYESIHCNVDDNPAVNLEEYESRLLGLPSDALRRAMRHGEWVIEGQFFSEWAPAKKDKTPWHVITEAPTYHGKPLWEAKHIEIVRVVDWGYSASGNPGVCLWFACLADGSAMCFREYIFKETLPGDVARNIARLSKDVRVRYTVGDTAMWQEHTGPSIAEQLAKAGLGMIEADKARIPGWVEVHEWLRTTVFRGTVEAPKLTFYEPGCPHTIRTLPEMVVDPKDPNDLETRNVEDDPADCVRYFVMSRPGKSAQPHVDPALAWMWKQIRKRRAAGDRLGTESTRRSA